jgi:hypothetical protein
MDHAEVRHVWYLSARIIVSELQGKVEAAIMPKVFICRDINKPVFLHSSFFKQMYF